MYGFAEEPGGSPAIVQRDHSGHASCLVEEIEDGFHEVVRLYRASGNIHDGDAGLGSPVPAQVIIDTHSTGGIALHGMDATIGSTGAYCYHGEGFGCEAINPFGDGYGLVGGVVGAGA